MPAFEEARQQTDQEVMVNLLTRLAEDPAATQRGLASELGIALGMMSQYMKSCMRKGYVRTKQVAPRRWAYFVTPAGFAEKSRMVVSHLSHSMGFFRETRIQVEAVFSAFKQHDIKKIALVGPGDVADIAELVAKDFDLSLFMCEKEAEFSVFESALITDVIDPQGTYDVLKQRVEEEKIKTLPILCIARKRINSVAQLERKKA